MVSFQLMDDYVQIYSAEATKEKDKICQKKNLIKLHWRIIERTPITCNLSVQAQVVKIKYELTLGLNTQKD